MENLRYWLWLNTTFEAGNPQKWSYLACFDNIKQACETALFGELTPQLKALLGKHKIASLELVDSMIEYCSTKNINIYCYEDDGFPQRLRDIYNPPAVIFAYGKLDFIDDSVSVAIVGARKPSPYSVTVTERISKELAQVGTVIISGFAIGIDSLAHKGALEVQGRTIAVLACGLEYDYPIGNGNAKPMIAKNGAVISEYPPKTPASPTNFIARNRLISALSLGVLIVEASERSGSLNTASYALSQGRDIFCVPPHDIFDERYAGVISLLRDGATPVFSHIDVMFQYYSGYSHKLGLVKELADVKIESDDALLTAKKPTRKAPKTKTKAKIEPAKVQAEETIEYDFSGLSEIQTKICELLKQRPMLADEISLELNVDISQVLTELTELEIFGAVKNLTGKRYSL